MICREGDVAAVSATNLGDRDAICFMCKWGEEGGGAADTLTPHLFSLVYVGWGYLERTYVTTYM